MFRSGTFEYLFMGIKIIPFIEKDTSYVVSPDNVEIKEKSYN